MMQLSELVKPTWEAEEWLNRAWKMLEPHEQLTIKKRVDELFLNGLPFQLDHDKIIYMNLFSMLTQLEISGFQGALKASQLLTDPAMKTKMRLQFVDEVFHATVFAKITYKLATPYALPPSSKGIDRFVSLLDEEKDMKTLTILINLIGEGWLEEIFVSLKKYKIAETVVDIVLDDESRHLSDYSFFSGVGLPDLIYFKKRLGYFEETIMSMFSHGTYIEALTNVLGLEGIIELINNVDAKYYKLLSTVNTIPSTKWKTFVKTLRLTIQDVFYNQKNDPIVPLSMTRRATFSQWSDPSLPTMSTSFGIDVTEFGFFEKKFPPNTLTCLMLQTISKTLADHPELKNYLHHHKLYFPQHAYVGLGVKLPECGDRLGLIEFKDCHTMNLSDLAQHIGFDLKVMAYCHKRAMELKAEHPYLADIFENNFPSIHDTNAFPNPLFPKPTICLSNIGQWGWELAVSPLIPNETAKLTLTKVERKQVWNNESKQFEIRDILPVYASMDHRALDANHPIPEYMQTAYDDMFKAFISQDPSSQTTKIKFTDLKLFIERTEQLLADDLGIGFSYLLFASLHWKNHDAKAILKTKDHLMSEPA